MRLLILHGPNLNLLGIRNRDIYGVSMLPEINSRLIKSGEKQGFRVETKQSNSEGELITKLQEAAFGPEDKRYCGVLINPGAFAHGSYAIHDAVEAIVSQGVKVVEVHISNVFARERFRAHLVTAPAASGFISGLGSLSYDLGLEALMSMTREQNTERGDKCFPPQISEEA